MSVLLITDQLPKLRLGLGLSTGADFDLSAFPVGGVSDIDRCEPALPMLLPVLAFGMLWVRGINDRLEKLAG